MIPEQRIQRLEIALNHAQAQRNEQAEGCINLVVELTLARQQVAAQAGELEKLREEVAALQLEAAKAEAACSTIAPT